MPDTSDAFPLDAAETLDTDGATVGNNADPDDDGDGILDGDDPFPLVVTNAGTGIAGREGFSMPSTLTVIETTE